ncbi:MAG: DUF2087 domain-containing protein [Anaerolineae bacterium]
MTAEDEKILQIFTREGELLQMPARRNKQAVILRWVVERFAFGVQYPEKQVNEILKQVNPDYSMLRRYLIDEGLMQRENGVYWRVQPAETA